MPAAIPSLRPAPHPGQPGVVLDRLAVEELHLTSGGALDGPASLRVVLRPYAAVTLADGTPACLSAPGADRQGLDIPDLLAFVAGRAAAGDPKPLQALGLLVEAVGEEYVRRNTPAG